MIRFALVLIAFASAAVGQDWPARVGGITGHVHEFEQPVVGWFGMTIADNRPAGIFDDPRAMLAFAEEAGIDADSLEYERRSAHVAIVRRAREGESADGFRYVVVRSASPLEGGRARLHRTWFRFRAPDEPRGVVVLMPGMLGTPGQFLDRFETTLHREGWAVLRMLVPPSRTTEHRSVVIDSEDPEATLRDVAAELDERTAECAYAVEAALGWARSIQPEVRDLPSVLIGMSGTGMMLPAVLARNENAFVAAVAIGTGANAFKILRESSYGEVLDSIRVSWHSEEPDRDTINAIDELYLDYARLDAFALAPLIADTPTLVIMGAGDHAVPTQTGELLWRRLGEPERWLLPVGHELLFGLATLRMNEIVHWLGAQTDGAKE